MKTIRVKVRNNQEAKRVEQIIKEKGCIRKATYKTDYITGIMNTKKEIFETEMGIRTLRKNILIVA